MSRGRSPIPGRRAWRASGTHNACAVDPGPGEIEIRKHGGELLQVWRRTGFRKLLRVVRAGVAQPVRTKNLQLMQLIRALRIGDAAEGLGKGGAMRIAVSAFSRRMRTGQVVGWMGIVRCGVIVDVSGMAGSGVSGGW